jgi:hypothetical protein
VEYADSGTLRVKLTWKDKINMAILFHDEGIVHRDLVNSFILYLNLSFFFIIL